MSKETHNDVTDDLAVSLVRGDFLYRIQRRIGLIPADGLGLGRLVRMRETEENP